MSYTSPKYTYISQQPAYDKLQEDVTGAADIIAEKKQDAIEEERLQGEKQWELEQGATQAHINNSISYNTIGNQDTQGAVSRLFEGSGKRVGELTRLTQGPNAQCKTDGNCDVLMKELGRLKTGPVKVQQFITNLADQLDYSGITNFDTGQNSRAQMASNIMAGKTKMNAANGYTYDLKDMGDGSYDIVFNYNGKDEKGGFFNPESGEYDSSWSMNSAALQDITSNEGSLFVTTPQSGKQSGSIIQDSGLYAGATYDESGKRTGGSYASMLSEFIKTQKSQKKGADGEAVEIDLYTSYTTGKGENKTTTNLAIIDRDKIYANQGIKNSIDEKIAGFVGPGGEDGRARAYFNQTLSKRAKGTTFDAELAKEVFKEAEWFNENIDDETLKTKWGETMSKWSYNSDLTKEQELMFAHLYKEEMIDEIEADMNADTKSRTYYGTGTEMQGDGKSHG